MASNPPPPDTQPAMSSATKTTSILSEKLSAATAKAKEYASFWAQHVKKGEMPWTHWYCCQSVEGKECETENHRIHHKCKTCGHEVCENCVKGTL